jgi:hypothetical protein
MSEITLWCLVGVFSPFDRLFLINVFLKLYTCGIKRSASSFLFLSGSVSLRRFKSAALSPGSYVFDV